MRTNKVSFCIFLLICSVNSIIQAQNLVSVYPQEYPDALKNPLKGFRGKADRNTIKTIHTPTMYTAGITILEPYSQTPGIFFDIKNFLSKSQTQPLCRIGIGKDLGGSYEVNPTLFGDPVADDTRSYSLTAR